MQRGPVFANILERLALAERAEQRGVGTDVAADFAGIGPGLLAERPADGFLQEEFFGCERCAENRRRVIARCAGVCTPKYGIADFMYACMDAVFFGSPARVSSARSNACKTDLAMAGQALEGGAGQAEGAPVL